VGVTIRVTIYELKSKTALRYHFCFSLPTPTSMMSSSDSNSASDPQTAADRRQHQQQSQAAAATTIQSTGRQRSLVCFDDDGSSGGPGETSNKNEMDIKESDAIFHHKNKTATTTTTMSGRLDQNIGMSTFCRAFPWHFMVDRSMQLVQLGVGFIRLFGADLKKMGRHLDTYFQLKKPHQVEPQFDKILKKANSPFVLAVRHVSIGKQESHKAKLQVSLCTLLEADCVTQRQEGQSWLFAAVYVVWRAQHYDRITRCGRMNASRQPSISWKANSQQQTTMQ